MALNFPDNPSVGQLFSDATSGYYYKWDGYVWQSFSPGSSSNIQTLDDISNLFNGVTTSFTLTSGGVSITPLKSAQLVINLGGIVQDPLDDYFVNGSTLIFSEPPESTLSFSGISLGPAVPISNIIDGTIVPQDLSTGGPWWTSDYKVGIGTSSPTSLLDVEGNAIIAGILTASSLQASNIRTTGIITANNVVVGASQTSLVVLGDARITGILTIGTGSITLNGSTNNITGISSITDSSNRKLVALASGVKVLYYEATAPVGWTKITTHHDKCLRVVNTSGGGSGGITSFTSVFTSRTPGGSVSGSNSGGSVANTTATGSVSGSNSGGSVSNTTLTTTQIPSHSHNLGNVFPNISQPGSSQLGSSSPFTFNYNTSTSGNTGGGGSHNHGFTDPSWSGSINMNAHNHSFTNPSWSGSFSGNAMDFDVQYIDMILCSFN